jgi:hypothetical protein
MTKSVPLLTGVTASMGRLDITDSFRPALGAISRNLAPRSTDNNNIYKRKRESPGSQSTSALDTVSFGQAAHNGYVYGGDTLGKFMNPERTNSSPLSFLPISQGADSESASGGSCALHGTTIRSDLEHNVTDLQQHQGGAPLVAWELDEDILAFTDTMGFPTDITDTNGDPLEFFESGF